MITTGLALAVAALLALMLLSGRLPPLARRRVEIAVRVVAVAVFVPVYGWGLVTAVRDGEWLWLAMQPLLGVWIAVGVVRERRRKARAQTRQPGTFA